METGGKGPEPNFTDYEQTSRRIKLTLYNPKRAKATKFARTRRLRKHEDASHGRPATMSGLQLAETASVTAYAAQTWYDEHGR